MVAGRQWTTVDTAPCSDACLDLTAGAMPDKASDPLLAQLSKTLEKDEEQREAMIKKIKVGCA